MLTICIRCLVGCILGSALGIVVILLGWFQQGLGLAIIGALLGLALSMASVWYRTTATETFWRGFLFFLRWTAAKNIPFGGELVPFEEKVVTSIRSSPNADPVSLDNRMYFGMKVGAACTAIPAILVASYLREDAKRGPAPWVLDILVSVVIVLAITMFVGGACGAALGALTVPGVHRRNILLGTVFGVLIGVGVSIATMLGAKIPAWQVYCFDCLVFGWLGMVCGLFAGDNFCFGAAGSDADEDDLPPDADGT